MPPREDELRQIWIVALIARKIPLNPPELIVTGPGRGILPSDIVPTGRILLMTTWVPVGATGEDTTRCTRTGHSITMILGDTPNPLSTQGLITTRRRSRPMVVQVDLDGVGSSLLHST